MKLKTLVLGALVITLLQGCMNQLDHDGRKIDVLEVFNELKLETDAFKGKSIDNLISVLGIPDDEKLIAGNKIIYWNLDKLVVMHDSYVVKGLCTIKASINKKRKVTDVTLNGNNAGCSKFLEKFSSS